MKLVLLAAVALLLSGCASQAARCELRLRPINAPAAATQLESHP